MKKKFFLERDKGLKVGEAEERMIFIIFVMGSSLMGA